MRRAVILLVAVAGCVPAMTRSDRPPRESVELQRRAFEKLAGSPMAPLAKLPPHAREVALGLFSCDRGFVMRPTGCVPESEVVRDPTIEISDLPSAGDGAPGTCPSGGCWRGHGSGFARRHGDFHRHGYGRSSRGWSRR